jgi:ATP-dependent DNA ligase
VWDRERSGPASQGQIGAGAHWRVPSRVKAGFIPPMLLLRSETLPDDPARWAYELKLDGYRAIAFKSDGGLHLRSRNDNDFAARYPSVLPGLKGLPAETVVDGEIVAFDAEGRPSFNLLQNYDPPPRRSPTSCSTCWCWAAGPDA